jgi:hypothetical protein
VSGRNGDKARFNLYRRRKLAKRQRVWAFFEAPHPVATPRPAAAPKRAEPVTVAAAAPVPAAAEKPKRAKPAETKTVDKGKKAEVRSSKQGQAIKR